MHPDELTPMEALRLVYDAARRCFTRTPSPGCWTNADLRRAQQAVVQQEALGHHLDDLAGLGAGTGASNIAWWSCGSKVSPMAGEIGVDAVLA